MKPLVSEELKYGGRLMDSEPVNLTLNAVAVVLQSGNPVVAILEPGDATRYRLCLVPCWAPTLQSDLGDIGVSQERAREYLLVTKFDSKGGEAFFAYSGVQAYDLETVQNKWSREFLSWWLRRLWIHLSEGEQ